MREFSFVERVKDMEGLKLPERSTQHSAGYDIFSIEDFTVAPKEKYMLRTGIKARMQDDEVLMLNVRSSMGKKNIMMANTIGWVDSDYYNNEDNEGEIGLCFYNYGDEVWEVKKGDRVGQAMFVKFLTTTNDNADGIRKGGWGSTNG